MTGHFGDIKIKAIRSVTAVTGVTPNGGKFETDRNPKCKDG